MPEIQYLQEMPEIQYRQEMSEIQYRQEIPEIQYLQEMSEIHICHKSTGKEFLKFCYIFLEKGLVYLANYLAKMQLNNYSLP